jgi:hypothetical protein
VQVAASLVLVQVKNKRERSLLVRPLDVEKTSRLRSRDPVASGVKCGLHGGKNGKMKSVDGFLVEPQNQGRAGTSWEPSYSGDWQRLHQVRGVCSGSTQNHRVTRLSHKAEAEDRVWLSGRNRPNWFGEPV